MAERPTDLDRDNAERREEIAARQNAEYGEALALCMGALGPEWKPWMKISLIPADHRKTGDTTPVATVVKAYRGELKLTENSVFLRRMPDGSIGKADNYEALFGDLLQEKHPTMTVEVRGQHVAIGRWELVWGALETYHPRSAEQLASLRVSRERGKQERELARWLAENPLLAQAGIRPDDLE